jgi:hypothetical protein
MQARYFLVQIIFDLENEGDIFFRTVSTNTASTALHITNFVMSTVRSSNPTNFSSFTQKRLTLGNNVRICIEFKIAFKIDC